LQNSIAIDSAGTIAYHIGEPPDERAQSTAIKRGFDLSMQRARKVSRNDFDEFDYLIAMDMDNEEGLQSICPTGMEDKIHLFLNFALNSNTREVPDPYYGRGNSGFERVLDLIEDASEGLLAHLKTQHSI
jgi:protein-tyrosine phosphatase